MDIDIATGFVWFLAFLFSTTVHEAMHALVAFRLGDPTAYHGGQVSLSPLPHIQREPIGMLVLPLLTSFTQGWAMGWASAPYDPRWAQRYPQRAALMAAAGPAGNFGIALAAFIIMKVGLLSGWLIAPDSVNLDHMVESATAGGPTFVASALSVLLVFNVFIGLFNLLPVPPLDGWAVLGLFLSDRQRASTRQIETNPAMSMIGLLIAWQVFPMFTGPIFNVLLRLLYPDVSYG
jgi:Zn-dependent protease